MEFTGTTEQIWTMQSLWIALAISIGAAITFAALFLLGYVAQTLRPKTRFARYFQETGLFALWMVSMVCGLGLSLMLFILGVHRFSTENPFLSGFFTSLSIAAILSPVLTVYAITHTHAHTHKKRLARQSGSTSHTKQSARSTLSQTAAKAKRPARSAKATTKPAKPKPKKRTKK